jgi:probable addiction module antidote protein
MEGAKMTKTLSYDSAEFLKNPEAIQHYMDEAFATGDPAFIAHALGTVARAKSMTEIARKTGLSRESLYRALSADGHPELTTILKVLSALDLQLSTQPTRRPPAKARARARPAQKTVSRGKPARRVEYA